MAKAASTTKAWFEALQPAARARGLRFVSGTVFSVDDVYLASIEARPARSKNDPDRLQIDWDVRIKPLALDAILWEAFLPDVAMSARMKVNRRVNGAFQVRSVKITGGSLRISPEDQVDWEPVLSEFERARGTFIRTHPLVSDFALALDSLDDGVGPGPMLVRKITSLVAADRAAEGISVAAEAIERGERGLMSSKVDVLHYLHAYARGPQSHEAFLASLLPTHEYRVLFENQSSKQFDLAREHNRGGFHRDLTSLDGSDPWAVILSSCPVDDFSTLSYLQAAGTAEAMIVELCRPGGTEHGAVAVRSKVGRAGVAPDGGEVSIELPQFTEVIPAHEAFTAAEAVSLFEAFYRSGVIGDGHVLRPVEGFAADGASINLLATTDP